MGTLICSALGRSVLAVGSLPGLCLSQGEANPGLCPGTLCSSACAVGFPLPATQLSPQCHCPSPSELVPEPHSPLCRDPLPLPEPTPSPGLTAPSMWSHRPSPSKLLRVQLWALQSFRELGRGIWCSLLGAQVSISVPGSPRASPPSWRPAPTPCGCLSTREDW